MFASDDADTGRRGSKINTQGLKESGTPPTKDKIRTRQNPTGASDCGPNIDYTHDTTKSFIQPKLQNHNH
eukprot:3045769-Amphidinium_carterae.1